LVIVTKLGAKRPPDHSWQPAISPQDLTDGVHDNLRHLGLEALDIVNYRAMGAIHGPAEGSIAAEAAVLSDLKRKGLIRHIGLSNVTAAQVAEAQAITDIVCVQNNYNLAQRHDDTLIDDLARQGIPYVPFFPLGGVHAAAVVHSFGCRGPARGQANAGCAGVAASPLAQHLADPWHIVGGSPA
jgi:pyridoxine 4-dehydrogenase